MFKKIIFIIVSSIIILYIILFSPLASLILKTILETKIEKSYKADIEFENFTFKVLKGLKVDRITFNKDNFKLTTEKAILNPKSISLLKKKIVIDCYIEKVNLESKNFFVILDILSKVSDVPSLSNLSFDYIKMDILIDNGFISFENIEAIGKKSKVSGDIIRDCKKTDYNIDLYIPREATKDMPAFTKKLLDINDEGEWSKIDIEVSVPNK